MENVATTATFIINNSFWQQIPAAAYVLLGVIISGVFTMCTDYKNRKNNKELKELEEKYSKEAQAIEIQHKEKLQALKEKGDKSLRLLDDRIKVFTEFHENFSIIRSNGKLEERLERTHNFRKTLYKVKLLTPDMETQLKELDFAVCDYANHLIKSLSPNKENHIEGDKIITKIINQTEEILRQLSKQL